MYELWDLKRHVKIKPFPWATSRPWLSLPRTSKSNHSYLFLIRSFTVITSFSLIYSAKSIIRWIVIFRFKSYNPIFSALEKYLRTRNYVITFKHVSHFTDLWKRRAIGPGKHYIHDVRSEGFYIGLHINLKFSFLWYFSNTTGWLLQERKTFNSIVNLTYFSVKTLGMTERMKAMVNMMAKNDDD